MTVPNKPRGQLGVMDKQGVKTTPFGQNQLGEKAYRRVERIVAATHLVTNHVPDSEPLKKRLRELSIVLLSAVLGLRDEFRVGNSNQLRVVQAYIRELVSLVRVTTIAGFVSQHNSQTLADAVDELGAFLATLQKSSLSESVLLDKDEITHENIKDTYVVRDLSVRDSGSDNSRSVRIASDMNRTTDRSSRIAHLLLSSNREMGIRDVVTHLPEYSEKMIQRELARLVASGRVKKSGSKRWSLYSMVGEVGRSPQ